MANYLRLYYQPAHLMPPHGHLSHLLPVDADLEEIDQSMRQALAADDVAAVRIVLKDQILRDHTLYVRPSMWPAWMIVSSDDPDGTPPR
ncbi:hypothetical protein [Hoyosella altamirensis]|uniref:hypothetical protein n=1 Tax=Hoyosella altamirensis TaxID=616997 RepID=UPI0007DB2B4E|nr:hypothetical protein [Hoyosella altamirensis]